MQEPIQDRSGQDGIAVATHVERRSRFLLAATVPRRTASVVTQATHRLFRSLPTQLLKTLTVDNGSEWGAFQDLQRVLPLRVYFAAPYAAWERGTNENTTGLVWDYFLKHTDFSRVPPAHLANVVRSLNNRPRKCLASRTPAEVLRARFGVTLRVGSWKRVCSKRTVCCSAALEHTVARRPDASRVAFVRTG